MYVATFIKDYEQLMNLNDVGVCFFKGFTDPVYRARRKEFADIAINYRKYVCHVKS